MPQSNYRVVFHGELLPGHSLDQVKLNLQKFFRCEDAAITRIFGDPPTLVTETDDGALAERYRLICAKAGMACTVEVEGGEKSTGTMFDPDAAPTPPPQKSTIRKESAAKPVWRILILLALLFTAIYYYWRTQIAVYAGVGFTAPQIPQQTNISTPTPFKFKGFTVTPLAQFALKARVLSRKKYSYGTEADLSPVDLALGWGPMSDNRVLKKISISQHGRFYFWSTKDPPIPMDAIALHSANMHMIPATAAIERRIKSAGKGDVIALKGFLVSVNRADGWSWVSSMTREDTGGGACEVIFVADFTIIKSI